MLINSNVFLFRPIANRRKKQLSKQIDSQYGVIILLSFLKLHVLSFFLIYIWATGFKMEMHSNLLFIEPSRLIKNALIYTFCFNIMYSCVDVVLCYSAQVRLMWRIFNGNDSQHLNALTFKMFEFVSKLKPHINDERTKNVIKTIF